MKDILDRAVEMVPKAVALAFLAVGAFQACGALLNVTIFYQTMSPNSILFFLHQFGPAYKIGPFRDSMHVELVPYGSSWYVGDNYTSDHFNIWCTYGPLECIGNVIHSCFFMFEQKNQKQVEYTLCTMARKYPPLASRECALALQYAPVDFKWVSKCARSTVGMKLQYEAAQKTKAMESNIQDIPTIVLNGHYDEGVQQLARHNFTQLLYLYFEEVCSVFFGNNALKSSQPSKPKVCSYLNFVKMPKIKLDQIQLNAVRRVYCSSMFMLSKQTANAECRQQKF